MCVAHNKEKKNILWVKKDSLMVGDFCKQNPVFLTLDCVRIPTPYATCLSLKILNKDLLRTT